MNAACSSVNKFTTLNPFPVDNLNVFLRGNNVAIIKSANSNIDPEGVLGAFLIKSWQFGINLNF